MHGRRIPFCVLLVTSLNWFSATFSQEYPTATVPPNLAVWKHTPTGVMYVDQALLEEYKALKERVSNLRGQVFRSGGTARTAEETLAGLTKELQAMQAKLDERKVHAQPFGVYTQRDTQSIELGESQQVVITSDDVMIRGWNGNNIKCVIEKFILSETKPDESEYDKIVVQHQVRQADDLLGKSDQDREAYEKEYLQSEAGKKLTKQALENRAKINAEIRDSYLVYRPLQGHAVNVLEIVGLSGQQGNKHLTGRTQSPGGGATLGGYWRRSAKVTIYIPKCKHVAVRGCTKAVDIKSVQANLILTTHGSQDIEYGGNFEIKDIDGDVSIDQAPIRVLQSVRGNVEFRQTNELTNTSTMHRGKFRTSMSPPPEPTTINDIQGNLQGEFVRANLMLDEIDGSLDVINEYGSTRLLIDHALSPGVHRVVSHSGVIRAILPKPDSAGVKLFAFTQTGTAQVGFSQKTFDDRSFNTGGRSWYGFQSAGVKFGWAALQRPQLAWRNENRSEGLDLVSNSGAVIVGPAGGND